MFKPADEEPLAANNPKGRHIGSEDGHGLRHGIAPGEGAIREVAAYLLDHGAPLAQGLQSLPFMALCGGAQTFVPIFSHRSPGISATFRCRVIWGLNSHMAPWISAVDPEGPNFMAVMS